MNKLKNLSIKLILTIPAICIGICAYLIFIYRYSQFKNLVFGPFLKLWSTPSPKVELPPVEIEKHKFI